MKCVEKLEILNGMKFIEVDSTSEDLIYVLVEDSKHNREEIGKILGNKKLVIDEYKCNINDNTIDITRLAFENCCAGGFKNGKFVF